MELEKCASIFANTDLLQKQLFTGRRMTVLQILENSQESNCSGILFHNPISTVTGVTGLVIGCITLVFS